MHTWDKSHNVNWVEARVIRLEPLYSRKEGFWRQYGSEKGYN